MYIGFRNFCRAFFSIAKSFPAYSTKAKTKKEDTTNLGKIIEKKLFSDKELFYTRSALNDAVVIAGATLKTACLDRLQCRDDLRWIKRFSDKHSVSHRIARNGFYGA